MPRLTFTLAEVKSILAQKYNCLPDWIEIVNFNPTPEENLDISDARWLEILNCIKANQKLNAIKLYREISGFGLKESKDYIDSLSQSLGY